MLWWSLRFPFHGQTNQDRKAPQERP